MKFLSLMFAFISATCVIFSQTTPGENVLSGRKMNVRKAANYYLRKKIDLSKEFSARYTSVFAGLRGYTRRDSLLATKLINRLSRFDSILFYRLMRIRLEWEFKQHLAKPSLDSVLPLLKNNADSSKYFYMTGLYFKDSMTGIMARSLGKVKPTYEGDEIVDWRTMKLFNWRDPNLTESNPHYGGKNSKIDRMEDSAIYYFKKAIEADPTEFHYLRELIFFMYNFEGDKDAEIKQVITSKMETYNGKEKKRLKKYLNNFYKK